MSDDVQHEDLECPYCGEWEVYYQPCFGIGCDDGQIDGYDEDPLWFDEGDTYPCPTCGGNGFFRWCAKCGAELARFQFSDAAAAPDAGGEGASQGYKRARGVVQVPPGTELPEVTIRRMRDEEG
jgi:hypothetical protein